MRRTIPAFVTQRDELQSKVPTLRPGALATLRHGGEDYSFLFLHPKSFDQPRDWGLRDDMFAHTASLKRKLDKAAGVDRRANFIVMGDAACAFNPLYGQGMTVAGMEALALGNLLKNYDAKQLRGFADVFQKRLAKTVKDTWTMATGEDYRYPATDGARPGLMTRISHKYIDLMLLALPYDEVVGLAFLEAMNLTRSPMRLMHPRILWRVLRYRLWRSRQPDIEADSKRQLQGT